MKLKCDQKIFSQKQKGLTLIELTVTLAIISVLALGILPMSKISYKRSKELELRRNLRTIRNALDAYKKLSDEKKISVEISGSGYPKELDILVKGVDLQGPIPMKMKFLRRIPKDPMTEDGQWGLRSYADETGSRIWGGQDVYDIYSQSEEKALDGTYYRDW